eukprot:CAMPEP_0206193916 /NCGR_PEP_ID=MMETSP0166-20121206/6868_1 /ASSEMBLY_ACC=CAM_ASM_000260 /TAXON_ID=95228 /ORGANISM="Vannella robusta, Strain DIVA3 518/3/11/1/6" /LENGTH=103 /DNA_ID=CAMNT_0053610753 /DNA_START=41 /DNA_END=352 /DNA_ORIENTATION=+
MSTLKRLIPTLDRILVKRVVPEAKTATGILLPDSMVSGQKNVAEVVAVGPGRRADNGDHIPVSFQQGDKILLPESFLSTEVKLDGEEYLLLKEDDVLGSFAKE